MTNSEKLAMVKSLLRISDTSMDDLLTTYLNVAKSEILGWRYSYDSGNAPSEVPAEYERVGSKKKYPSSRTQRFFGKRCCSDFSSWYSVPDDNG